MKQARFQYVVPPTLMLAATAVSVAASIAILTTAPARQATLAALAPALVAPVPAAMAPPTPASRTFVGREERIRTGAVQATITVADGKIIAVTIIAPRGNPRSAYINKRAIPALQSKTLEAQNAAIDSVSGATVTSQAYVTSLQAALDQAHLS